MAIDPHREYSPTELARESRVPLPQIRAAIRRRDLYARPGRRGRGNYPRVLGANFIAWLERLHRLAPEARPAAQTPLQQIQEENRRRLRRTPTTRVG